MALQPLRKTLSIVATILVLATLVWLRSRQQSFPFHTQLISRTVKNFRVSVLSEEPCAPGRIIHGDPNKGITQAYSCTSHDALIAWVRVQDVQTGKGIDSCRTICYDESGNSYFALTKTFGDLVLIRLEKGYSQTPNAISARLDFSQSGEPAQESLIRLTKIPKPTEELPMLSDQEIIQSQQTARVSFTSGPNVLNFQLTKPLARDEFFVAHVLGLTYCASGNGTSSSEVDLPSELVSAYGGKTDTVKVRIERYKLADSDTVLTYKDATLHGSGNARAFRFPTSQVIGSLAGVQATLGGNEDANAGKPSTNQPRITIKLGIPQYQTEELAGWMGPQGPLKSTSARTYWTLKGTKPSLDELELPNLIVRTSQASTGTVVSSTYLASKANFVSKDDREVPKLEFLFHLKTPRMTSSQTVVLPLHHRKKGPMMNFIPAPRIQASPGGK